MYFVIFACLLACYCGEEEQDGTEDGSLLTWLLIANAVRFDSVVWSFACFLNFHYNNTNIVVIVWVQHKNYMNGGELDFFLDFYHPHFFLISVSTGNKEKNRAELLK